MATKFTLSSFYPHSILFFLFNKSNSYHEDSLQIISGMFSALRKASSAFIKGSGGLVITACITLHGRSAKKMEILQTLKGIKDQLDEKTQCKQANIYQDIDDENCFFLVEDWHCEDDFDEHLSSGLFKVSLGINPILEEPLEVKVFGFLRMVGL